MLVSLMSAGCARFHPEPLSPALNAAALEGRNLDDPRLHRFLQASLAADQEMAGGVRWDLERLTLAALYFHPDLAIARAKLAAARADIITARQRPNPTVSIGAAFNASAVASALPPGALPLTVGPVVNFLVETFGKREDRTAQARHLEEVARADLATASWQVRGRVRTALLNLWASRKRLELARQQVVLRQQLVSLLEQRLGAGFATTLDVTRERIALTQATLGTQDVGRVQADARVQLATAIGVPVSALEAVLLSDDLFDHPAVPERDLASGPLRHRALTERSDVQASLAQYEATQSALQLAVAGQYPNVILGPGYNYDVGFNRFFLSPTFDLPIFNQNQGQIARAIADRQQAAASFTALQAQIIGAVDTAAVAGRATAQTLQTANVVVANEQVRQRQVRASFMTGETDRPTLVAGELELAVTQSAQFDAIVQQRQSLGALEDALQQPFFDPGAARFVLSAGSRTTTETRP
jgi:cobalt-zinc-cadmium efflux system outer membrane protein